MKNLFKGFIFGVTITLLLVLSLPTLGAQLQASIDVLYDNIKIVISGNEITPVDANGNTVEPFIHEGTTYLPVRAVAQAFNKNVTWDDANKTVIIEEYILKDEPTDTAGTTDNVEIADIEMENGSVISLELYPDIAPITCANFIKLVDEGFYNGLIFHRVIPSFMIQGGGYDVNNVLKNTATIKGEFNSNGVTNPLKHTRGVLSMARTPIPDSGTSQFFIMTDDAPHLDGEYAAFGMVITGMDEVDRIVNTVKDGQDKPIENQVIRSITRR